MKTKLAIAVGMALSLSAGSLFAQDKVESDAVTCADLNWSAEVLAANPDIGESCESVFEMNGELYAKSTVEVVRVRGNRITFRPLHTDGTMGDSRSLQLDSSWRAEIGGRSYRASDLMRGQQLDVYLPQDRFALAVHDDDGIDEIDLILIEEEVIEMPATASPLFLVGAAGAALLALGAMLTGLRRRFS